MAVFLGAAAHADASVAAEPHYTFRIPLQNSVASNQPSLKVSPQSLSFSDIVVGGSSSTAIIVENTGTAPLDLNTITYAGDSSFTVDSSLCSGTLGPGNFCALGVTFAPRMKGVLSGVINVQSGSGGSSVSVGGKGLQGELQAGVASVVFDPVIQGSNLSKSVSITNRGDALVESIEASTDSPFSVSGSCSALVSGDSCDLVVQFQPTEIGGASSNLRISSSVGSLTVELAGSSIAAQSVGTVLAGSPVQFGTVKQGSSPQDRVVSIRNDGNVPLTISGFTGLPGSVTVANNTCSQVAPGTSCDVTFRMDTASVLAFNQIVRSQGASTPASVQLTGSTIPSNHEDPANFHAYGFFWTTSMATPQYPDVYNTRVSRITGGAVQVAAFQFCNMPGRVVSADMFNAASEFIGQTTVRANPPLSCNEWVTSNLSGDLIQIPSVSFTNGSTIRAGQDYSASENSVVRVRLQSGQVLEFVRPAREARVVDGPMDPWVYIQQAGGLFGHVESFWNASSGSIPPVPAE